MERFMIPVEEQCSICFDKLELHTAISFLSSCNHMFHQRCLQNWAKTCPLCRKAYDEEEDVSLLKVLRISKEARELLERGKMLLQSRSLARDKRLQNFEDVGRKLKEEERKLREEERQLKEEEWKLYEEDLTREEIFLLRVKRKFKSNPRLFKCFLDLMLVHRRRAAPMNEVLDEAEFLLRHHPDLIVDLKHFFHTSSANCTHG